MSKWYFETSAFNYIQKTYSLESLLESINFQKTNQHEFLLSPITLWELMLTNEDQLSDLFILIAQNFFSKNLLATPSEIIFRYLKYAYPENKANYNVYSDLEIAYLWKKIFCDNSRKIIYDKKLLKNKTDLLRLISKHVRSIIGISSYNKEDFIIASMYHVVQVIYKCLLEDGFLPDNYKQKYDYKILFQIAIVFVLLFFVFKQDLYGSVLDKFWNNAGISDNDPIKKIIYVFETFPCLLKRGPIMELSIMAYYQVLSGQTNRGLILDCMHMIYAPYVDFILTNDKEFANLKNQESRYKHKIIFAHDFYNAS